MTVVAWVLVVWGLLALLGGAFATWFGWHLNRSRHARYLGSTARNRADALDMERHARPGSPPGELPVYK